MRKMDLTSNKYELEIIGFKVIKGFSRYAINGDVIYSLTHMKPLSLRKDNRYQIISDDGRRSIYKLSTIKGFNLKK